MLNQPNISTLFQRCFQFDVTSWRRTMSNQRRNNVVYVNVEIYNVEQRRINVDLHNVRRNIVIFNVDFHNVG